MPRKAKRVVSQATRMKMSRSAEERQARRRAHEGYTDAIEEVAANKKRQAKLRPASFDDIKPYLPDMGIVSLSAAAVSPATEISFVKSSVLARKEAARQTIEDCDALLAAWDRLGL